MTPALYQLKLPFDDEIEKQNLYPNMHTRGGAYKERREDKNTEKEDLSILGGRRSRPSRSRSWWDD